MARPACSASAIAGRTFSSVVGVDSNEQTRPDRGSVVFAVLVGDKKLFESPVMREGMPPVAVNVDLQGATEFTLEVTDGGDGIACDQAGWADAHVTLSDLSGLFLGDMVFADSREKVGVG